MRNKSVLYLMIGLLVPLFFFLHPAIQAQEVKSVSYTTIMQTAKNEPPGVPVKLTIPTAKISATIEQVGVTDEQMDTPLHNEDVGWYKDGFKPGEAGNAVIDGHLDDKFGEPAVFWKLGLLRLNDDIFTEDTQGKKLRFRVTDIREYPSDSVPMRTLFTKSLKPNLILITCAGEYDTTDKNYSDRLVVIATLVDE